MLSKAAIFGRHLFGFIWPVTCPICDGRLEGDEGPVCVECLSKIPRIAGERLIPYVGAPDNMVVERSWFVYDQEEPSHRLIHDIKYHDRPKLARRLGREFAMQKLADHPEIDVVLPIPLHWLKQVRRSYNQTYEIALGIRDVLGIPVAKNLKAVRPHDTQTRRTRADRAENVRGIFAVSNASELDGKNIALLDDVITTGATMFNALDCVLESTCPTSVTFLSLARTRLE